MSWVVGNGGEPGIRISPVTQSIRFEVAPNHQSDSEIDCCRGPELAVPARAVICVEPTVAADAREGREVMWGDGISCRRGSACPHGMRGVALGLQGWEARVD